MPLLTRSLTPNTTSPPSAFAKHTAISTASLRDFLAPSQCLNSRVSDSTSLAATSLSLSSICKTISSEGIRFKNMALHNRSEPNPVRADISAIIVISVIYIEIMCNRNPKYYAFLSFPHTGYARHEPLHLELQQTDENPSERLQPSLKCPISIDIPEITLYKLDLIEIPGGSYE